MLLFESGSGKFIRLMPHNAVQYHSDRANATPVEPAEVDAVIAQYGLEYVRHTLELQPAHNSQRVREHVKCMIRKISG